MRELSRDAKNYLYGSVGMTLFGIGVIVGYFM